MRFANVLVGALLGWTGNVVFEISKQLRAERAHSTTSARAHDGQWSATASDCDSIVQAVIARLDARETITRSRQAVQSSSAAEPLVIKGDLIVQGRLGVGGPPQPGIDQALTIHGTGAAGIGFIANEALRDPQRDSYQHRHVGSIGVSQDGGLRFSQNSVCYPAPRGCVADDWNRRSAYFGYDSMGDMSFYLTNVDSTTGIGTAPNAQSLVMHLIDWDGHIHIQAHRPGQKIIFNASTTPSASDLQWEVPFIPAVTSSPGAK